MDSADVVVVGGGPGGIGAAIAAARCGSDTILIERFGTLGGTWTSGLLSAVMVNWSVRGIFEEFRSRLDRLGAWRPIPESWKYWGGENPPDDPVSHEGTYDAETAKIVLDRMASEAGVRLYYFAQCVHVFKEAEDWIEAVVIQSKEGRHAIRGKVFVDSSGDGDLAALAGAEFVKGREEDGLMQPMTMIFKMDHVDTQRAQEYLSKPGNGNCRRAWQEAKVRGEVTVPREDLLLNPTPKAGQWQFNCTRITGFDATKVQDVSQAMVEGRRQVAEIVGFLRRHIPGFENAVLAETAPHIGVRETRRLRCDYTVTAPDIHQRRHHPDVIARGNWPVDIHNPKGGEDRVVPLRDGEWYEIPYRSTTVRGFRNLLVGSRCIDCTHEGHAGVRASPQVCAIGQGVGTAAAQFVSRNLNDVRDVDVAALQGVLRSQGALI